MPPGQQQYPGYMPQPGPLGYMPPPMYPPGFVPYMQQPPGFVPPYMPPGFPQMAPIAPIEQQRPPLLPIPVQMTSTATGQQAHYSSGLSLITLEFML